MARSRRDGFRDVRVGENVAVELFAVRHQICIDAEGNTLVADRGNNRLQAFAPQSSGPATQVRSNSQAP